MDIIAILERNVIGINCHREGDLIIANGSNNALHVVKEILIDEGFIDDAKAFKALFSSCSDKVADDMISAIWITDFGAGNRGFLVIK